MVYMLRLEVIRHGYLYRAVAQGELGVGPVLLDLERGPLSNLHHQLVLVDGQSHHLDGCSRVAHVPKQDVVGSVLGQIMGLGTLAVRRRIRLVAVTVQRAVVGLGGVEHEIPLVVDAVVNPVVLEKVRIAIDGLEP